MANAKTSITINDIDYEQFATTFCKYNLLSDEKRTKEPGLTEAKNESYKMLAKDLRLYDIEATKQLIRKMKFKALQKIRYFIRVSIFHGNSGRDALKYAPEWLRQLDKPFNLMERGLKIESLVTLKYSREASSTAHFTSELLRCVLTTLSKALNPTLVTTPDTVKELAETMHLDVHDLHSIWARLYEQALYKLRAFIEVADCFKTTAVYERLSHHDWRAAEIGMMYDPNLRVIHPSYLNSSITLYPLTTLFMLISSVKEALEKKGEDSSQTIEYCAERTLGEKKTFLYEKPELWSLVYSEYTMHGIKLSPILLQKRWHELQTMSRDYVLAGAKPPNALLDAVYKKFPYITTDQLPPWQDVVENKCVYMEIDFLAYKQRNNDNELIMPKYINTSSVELMNKTLEQYNMNVNIHEIDDDVEIIENKREVITLSDSDSDHNEPLSIFLKKNTAANSFGNLLENNKTDGNRLENLLKNNTEANKLENLLENHTETNSLRMVQNKETRENSLQHLLETNKTVADTFEILERLDPNTANVKVIFDSEDDSESELSNDYGKINTEVSSENVLENNLENEIPNENDIDNIIIKEEPIIRCRFSFEETNIINNLGFNNNDKQLINDSNEDKLNRFDQAVNDGIKLEHIDKSYQGSNTRIKFESNNDLNEVNTNSNDAMNNELNNDNECVESDDVMSNYNNYSENNDNFNMSDEETTMPDEKLLKLTKIVLTPIEDLYEWNRFAKGNTISCRRFSVRNFAKPIEIPDEDIQKCRPYVRPVKNGISYNKCRDLTKLSREINKRRRFLIKHLNLSRTEFSSDFWNKNINSFELCKPVRVVLKKVHRLVKKVELNDIDEVRRVNSTILTAHIAPITVGPNNTFIIDSYNALHNSHIKSNLENNLRTNPSHNYVTDHNSSKDILPYLIYPDNNYIIIKPYYCPTPYQDSNSTKNSNNCAVLNSHIYVQGNPIPNSQSILKSNYNVNSHTQNLPRSTNFDNNGRKCEQNITLITNNIQEGSSNCVSNFGQKSSATSIATNSESKIVKPFIGPNSRRPKETGPIDTQCININSQSPRNRLRSLLRTIIENKPIKTLNIDLNNIVEQESNPPVKRGRPAKRPIRDNPDPPPDISKKSLIENRKPSIIKAKVSPKPIKVKAVETKRILVNLSKRVQKTNNITLRSEHTYLTLKRDRGFVNKLRQLENDIKNMSWSLLKNQGRRPKTVKRDHTKKRKSDNCQEKQKPLGDHSEGDLIKWQLQKTQNLKFFNLPSPNNKKDRKRQDNLKKSNKCDSNVEDDEEENKLVICEDTNEIETPKIVNICTERSLSTDTDVNKGQNPNEVYSEIKPDSIENKRKVDNCQEKQKPIGAHSQGDLIKWQLQKTQNLQFFNLPRPNNKNDRKRKDNLKKSNKCDSNVEDDEEENKLVICEDTNEIETPKIVNICTERSLSTDTDVNKGQNSNKVHFDIKPDSIENSKNIAVKKELNENKVLEPNSHMNLNRSNVTNLDKNRQNNDIQTQNTKDNQNSAIDKLTENKECQNASHNVIENDIIDLCDSDNEQTDENKKNLITTLSKVAAKIKEKNSNTTKKKPTVYYLVKTVDNNNEPKTSGNLTIAGNSTSQFYVLKMPNSKDGEATSIITPLPKESSVMPVIKSVSSLCNTEMVKSGNLTIPDGDKVESFAVTIENGPDLKPVSNNSATVEPTNTPTSSTSEDHSQTKL